MSHPSTAPAKVSQFESHGDPAMHNKTCTIFKGKRLILETGQKNDKDDMQEEGKCVGKFRVTKATGELGEL